MAMQSSVWRQTFKICLMAITKPNLSPLTHSKTKTTMSLTIADVQRVTKIYQIPKTGRIDAKLLKRPPKSNVLSKQKNLSTSSSFAKKCCRSSKAIANPGISPLKFLLQFSYLFFTSLCVDVKKQFYFYLQTSFAYIYLLKLQISSKTFDCSSIFFLPKRLFQCKEALLVMDDSLLRL